MGHHWTPRPTTRWWRGLRWRDGVFAVKVNGEPEVVLRDQVVFGNGDYHR